MELSDREKLNHIKDKKDYHIFECLVCGKIFGVKKEIYSKGLEHKDFAECIERKTYPGTKSYGEKNGAFRHGEANMSHSKRSKTYKCWERMGKADKGRRCERWKEYKTFLEDVGEIPPNAKAVRYDSKAVWSPENFYLAPMDASKPMWCNEETARELREKYDTSKLKVDRLKEEE